MQKRQGNNTPAQSNLVIEKTRIANADEDSDENQSDSQLGNTVEYVEDVPDLCYVGDNLQRVPHPGSSNTLVPQSYILQGNQILASMENKFDILLTERKWPQIGWSGHMIELVLNKLAAMDSNNFESKACVGEREGRIFSDLVARRHFRMIHGIGRSGDLTELQPKAKGSSILSRLTNALVLDVCRTLVCKDVAQAFVSPMATGMSIGLVLMSLRKTNPSGLYVIWPRLDQKSCLKAIVTCGFVPLIVEGIQDGSEILTNLHEIDRLLQEYGSAVLCVLSTTSCFAPRVPDSLKKIAELCKQNNVPHVVNNAYGLQAKECTSAIATAHRFGRVDFFVQSTDKNLMVPVGGAIIAGFDKSSVDAVAQSYPGRASAAPVMDVFITLLSMGSVKYSELQKSRSANFKTLQAELGKLAVKYDEELISSHRNPISIGMTLKHIGEGLGEADRLNLLTQVGSMLFARHVFGSRVVVFNEVKVIDGREVIGWGSHCSAYPYPYLTAAASIGIEKEDIVRFCKKLDACLKYLRTKQDEITTAFLAGKAAEGLNLEA